MKKLIVLALLSLTGCYNKEYRLKFSATCAASCPNCGSRIECYHNDCRCICVVPKQRVLTDPNWMHSCGEKK